MILIWVTIIFLTSFFTSNLGKITTFHFRARDYVGRGGSQMFNHQHEMGTEDPNRY